MRRSLNLLIAGLLLVALNLGGWPGYAQDSSPQDTSQPDMGTPSDSPPDMVAPTDSSSPPPSDAAATPTDVPTGGNAAPAADDTNAAQPAPQAPPPGLPPRAVPSPGPTNTVVPLLAKPFAGEFNTGNFFDHDLPFEFTDHNGYMVTWWGLKGWPAIDGHSGYDWTMPEGTPLLAAAAGKVVFAAQNQLAPCPILANQSVGGNQVTIEHQVNGPSGPLRVRTLYEHLSQISVKVDQQVKQGDQIGLSGNTGCSTGPHLHFQVNIFASNKFIQTDPFGWEGPTVDPWTQNAAGAQSFWLWQPGGVPAISYRDVQRAPNPGPNDKAPVAITYFRWFSWHDDLNPNNEFLQLSLDPRFASTGSYVLTGHTLSNNAGDSFTFPDGFTIQQGTPVLIFMGSGQNSSTQLYWRRGAGAWNPAGDCAHLIRPNGSNVYRMATPGGSCS